MLRLVVVIALLIKCTVQQSGDEYKFKCGIRQFNLTGHVTVRDGKWTAAGDWPWHVAVFVQPEDGDGHFCSGALISKEYVLTTNDCVTYQDGEQSWAKHTTIQLGSDKINEQSTRYQVFGIERSGDLALLRFGGLEFFTEYIQPICINQVASGKGRSGTVVGWDEQYNLNGTKLKLVGNDQCEQGSSPDVLCVKNDANTCTIGGILYLRRGNAWYIGGVMSDYCETNALFNGLHKYISWIRKTTKLHYLAESNENCNPIDVDPQEFHYLLSHFTSSCGKYIVNKIAGGQTARVFEFPWMAIVLYREETTNLLSTLCMATLINHRYVMTTAQCANGDPFKPFRVRLGEHTVDQEEDCNANDEDDCAPPVQDVDVECGVGHQGYDPHGTTTPANNIGLIRLAKAVLFGDQIQPVCLPGTYDLARTRLPQYIVSGWGRNGSRHRQQTLQKAVVASVGVEECRARYEPFGLTMAEDQFCAGGGSSGGSCYGDSGASLGNVAGYFGEQKYVQFGIAAFGTFGCKAFPAVYTNVSVHIGWIIGNVRP